MVSSWKNTWLRMRDKSGAFTRNAGGEDAVDTIICAESG